MMRLSAIDYSSMSNSDLDDAVQQAFNAWQTGTGQAKLQAAITWNAIAQIIKTRQQSPLYAAEAAAGYSHFPKFDAIEKTLPGGFLPTDVSRQALATSAGNVVQSAKGLVSWGKYVVPLALVLGILYFSRRR